MNFKVIVEDPIVLKVLSKYYERSQLGIQKYGRTLDRDDLSLIDWLNHLQEELMDATLYIEKLKDEARKTRNRKAMKQVIEQIKSKIEDARIYYNALMEML